jgi:hypothetical protein
MNEHLAPEAERAYAETAGEEGIEAYAVVRVLDGHGVIEELYLDGVPVREYLSRDPRE